jgi:hypothetical protein
MLARLGDVLYWASLIVVALCAVWAAIVGGVFLTSSAASGENIAHVIAAAIIAIIAWLLGRACRYVLAGR